MSWKGMFIGSCLGSLFGGPIGSIFGAIVGHQLEKRLGGGHESVFQKLGRMFGGRTYSGLNDEKRELIFCACAAAMLAKMAKADGQVTASEISQVEASFRRLGFNTSAREYAINVFRKAKSDTHSIYEYAREFAAAVNSTEIRELFYELLWDVAGADGSFAEDELLILQRIPAALNIRAEWYAYFFNTRIGGSRGASRGDDLDDAYRVLESSPSDSLEEIRSKYRELAKKNHPDAMRAQGMPEAMVAKATERMARINEAWAAIRARRSS